MENTLCNIFKIKNTTKLIDDILEGSHIVLQVTSKLIILPRLAFVLTLIWQGGGL